MEGLKRAGEVDGQANGRHTSFLGSWYVDLLGSLVIGGISYFFALWLRWAGEVPSHLWQPIAYAAGSGLAGLVVGGSLVDLWSRHRSLAAIAYASMVASGVSVLFAMAAVYAFRVVAIPRLTFAVAAWLLWGGLVLWQGFRARGRVLSHAYVANSHEANGYSAPTHPESLARLMSERHPLNARILVLPGARELLLAASRFYEDGDRLLLEIHPRALQWPAPLFKRAADVLLSLVGIVLSFPVCLVAALAIRLDSPGPVWFRQARVGQGGRVFYVLKLRTMVDHAEDETGPVLASREDPRVTRVGRWLRAFRIDEFPQFINVLKGDMSLVGPRPERPEFVEHYRQQIEGYDLRHLVKPGITGLAQIRGHYDTLVEDKLRFDLAYIFLWSPLLDLKIMLQTIGIMLTPERARGIATSVRPAPAMEEAPGTTATVPQTVGRTTSAGL